MNRILVVEEKGVREYLEKRNILKQYKQAKQNFVEGRYQQIQLKKRQPRTLNEFQFRITKKYRAFGYFKELHVFIVIEISDHQ